MYNVEFCCPREALSRNEKLMRSYYNVLRDEMDQFVLGYSLVDSYHNFLAKGEPYPFVHTRELKPRARIPSTEFDSQNSFLILFLENCLDDSHKKYIRYFDINKTTKTNLVKHKDFPNVENFHRNIKNFDCEGFFEFVKSLMPVDYALLIQRDDTAHSRDRYALTHFHVRVDWPIADAAEDLAIYLRYISKDLYEKGDKYAENCQKKFFEYHGMPLMAGGRRTAAIVAAQYLRRIKGISTVYAGSSESRAVLKLGERGISKSILMRFSREEVRQIAAIAGITQTKFTKNYAIARENTHVICIFNTIYDYTAHAVPPEGGRLRELNSDTNWLTVALEQILPRPDVWKYPPIPFKIIYA
ncbi:conserved hypothetical protein [Desulfamplus magnetovallimortis]|uniref:Uncharacterized protein n=1 Tax=Desulfamplus magnetovallimortis TaxID=1246637 RepID=A0A1W1H5S2_9BACT|nr:hypothetical protein [Desulfamplus magnetovallimortis]SLM27802.1 conserved hypothetical protein [Desulfamplus magnetovallimortis]